MVYPSRRNTTESLNIEDHYDKFKFPGHEQHEDSRLNRLSSENKTAEYSESEGK